MFMYAALIVFFAFFYTAIVFNPQETADNLKKYGGFIPGIRPGTATADYFDHVLTRLTTVGGIYLVAVCLLPEVLISDYGLPFYFGGTSILIVVSVTMDTVTQIQSHLLAHQYEGLIRKARVRHWLPRHVQANRRRRYLRCVRFARIHPPGRRQQGNRDGAAGCVSPPDGADSAALRGARGAASGGRDGRYRRCDATN
jgi:hypothetical protein